MSPIREEKLSRDLGAVIEKCENFVAASSLQMPAHIHAEALSSGMKDVLDMLRRIEDEHSE